MGDYPVVGPVPTGTVTFLFSDIENSTALWDQHPVGMRVALKRHDRILQDVMTAHGGFVFSHGGDGVAVAFQRAGDAVTAAVEAQRVLLGEPWPAGVELRVRMGLHTGEADERDGDYFGPPLNRAARLMSAAHGGQILVSSTTADMLWSMTGIELVDQGSLDLRGVSEPVHAFGVTAEGVPWFELEPRTIRTLVGNLPAPPNEWFGSVAELRRRVANLPHRRLVTLTGPGGVGKTRMALEAAAVTADEYGDGVWLVELAPLADPTSVGLAVAATLSIQPQGDVGVVETIADWLRGRRLLLVLDNCEHLLAAAGDLTSAIVTRCPTVTVLATSREPLGVDGERVVPLSGLGIADAVDMFRDRVSSVDDTVTLSAADDHAAIEAICEQLDGLPLAIELAAARLRSMTLTEVRHRLGDRLRLLGSSSRRGLDRHRTLQATVDWSYQLLTGDERMLFDRLCVFAGGFDLPAAESICATQPLDAADVFGLLASLVDKSMLIADRNADETRYRLLETLRQFATERLAEAGNVDELRDRHLSHYVAVANQASRLWASPGQTTADDIFEREWDNLRAAQGWAVATANLHAAELIVIATGWHGHARARYEHGDWAERTLELESAGLHPMSATYFWAAHRATSAGENDAVIAFAERGILAAPWPDHPDAAECWGILIGAYVGSGRDGAAVEPARHVALLEPALADPLERWSAVRGLVENALANEPGSVHGLVDRLTECAVRVGSPSILSETARYRALQALYAEDPRDPQRAFTAAHDGVMLARSVGDPYAEGLNLTALAFAAVALHRPDADEICRDAITRLDHHRHWLVIWLVIETTAGFFAATGRLHQAAVLYGHLEAHRPPWGLPAVRRARQRGIDRVRQLVEFEFLMAQGADMDRDELVAYTLERLQDTETPQVEPL
jgi:predicted ATPase/class 3 adenylate cyclase